MGTNKIKSEFDCYSKAAPDEPVFTLIGRDPQAAWLVQCWAAMRSIAPGAHEDARKIAEARKVARDMAAYCIAHGRQPSPPLMDVLSGEGHLHGGEKVPLDIDLSKPL